MGAGERITFARNPERFLENAIFKFLQVSATNRRKIDGGKYWDKPLVGFASGEDPLFKQYKKIIGKFHLTPQEMFELEFGKSQTPLSVVSWILPMSEDIRKSNRKEKRYPSQLWIHARQLGEPCNAALRDHVVSLLTGKGYRAVAPVNSPHFKRIQSSRVGLAANWSERHAAYACGLGAFGLNAGLITAKGVAMRVGSVITELSLKPSEKIYPHHRANCLHYFNETCRVCAIRCPAGAISRQGYDQSRCYAYVHGLVKTEKEDEYGVKMKGCGLCQTKVPCEFEIPKLIRKQYAP